MPTPSVDQSTQVSFPVLLRSQQKALKRYATLTEMKPVPPRHLTHNWPVLTRPKSLNFALESAPNRLRLPGATSMNTLTPKQWHNESPNSYTGSVVSLSQNGSYERPSPTPSLIYSGQYKAVHQSKWKIGLNNPPGSLTPEQRLPPVCTCHQHGNSMIKNLSIHSSTPEGLSWRRLHMSRAKLKATATTSELLSGFAMVAMVELQINEPTTVPEWLFVLFAVCTTILVAVHIFALMISTYILPNIDAISKLDVCELVSESPHERMRGFIELAWAFSTILGLFLFLVEVAILCWVKFWDYSFTAAIAATVIVIPVLIMFVAFAVHFYHSLVVYKCDTSVSDIEKLETMKKELDLVSIPV